MEEFYYAGGHRRRSSAWVRPILAQSITDMVRISDARMSGTAYGTVVLHVAPEAAAGGPLAAVRNGDWIELDCESGRLHLDISDEELASRLAASDPTAASTLIASQGGPPAVHRTCAPGRRRL